MFRLYKLNTVSCDTLVVGGGVSGVSAAVASARTGAKTVLIEKDSFLGGIGYAGLLRYVCGLYLNGDSLPAETLNSGMVREIAGRLNSLSPHHAVERLGGTWVLPYSRADLLAVLVSLCRNEPDLRIEYNATAVSLSKTGERIVEAMADHSGTPVRFIPGNVIDCSGTGGISALAGARFEISPPERIQLAGYIFQIRGINGHDETISIRVPYHLRKAVAEGLLPPNLRYSTFTPGRLPGEGYCKLSIPGPDSADREERARKETLMVHRMLSERIPAFKDSHIGDTSLRVVDREGRRVTGYYTLTEEDVLGARKFPDGVVKNSWPVEMWDQEKGPVYKFVRKGDYYEIPFRCLMVRGISNLLCAGRCISVSPEALGSTRVMGACVSLGEEAGRASAHQCRTGSYSGYRDNV